MPHGIEPVTQGKAEIVSVQFDECPAQDRRTPKTQCKRVSFELKMSTEDGHTERQKLKHNQYQLIQTSNVSIVLITKTKNLLKMITK